MNFNNILFLDIETVSQFETYNHLPDEWRELWDLKAQIMNRNNSEETSETVYHRAGIYAEFGKIVCISCGCIQGMGEEKKLVIKSYGGEDEKKSHSNRISPLARNPAVACATVTGAGIAELRGDVRRLFDL